MLHEELLHERSRLRALAVKVDDKQLRICTISLLQDEEFALNVHDVEQATGRNFHQVICSGWDRRLKAMAYHLGVS